MGGSGRKASSNLDDASSQQGGLKTLGASLRHAGALLQPACLLTGLGWRWLHSASAESQAIGVCARPHAGMLCGMHGVVNNPPPPPPGDSIPAHHHCAAYAHD